MLRCRISCMRISGSSCYHPDGTEASYKKEMDICFDNLVSEINAMSPKIVFLLGEKVYSSVARHLHLDFEKWNDFEYHYTECNGTYYVPIHHPSYICVYKRKQMDDYIAAVEKMINELL